MNGFVENDKDEDENKENKDDTKDPMEILEDALILCKFGRFHVRLLFTTLAATCSSMMVSTTSSYILPNAECDLHMTIMEKGLLSSMPFFGQVGASLFTGFITDAFGRKMFLVGGLLGIFTCSIIEGSSQTYWMLAVGKVLEGICSSFCFATPSVMLSELVHKRVRDRVLLLNASFVSISLIMIASISLALLPLDINLTLIEGYFELYSWNIYLYACSACSLIGGISYYYLPESPKFLLSHGQENEALEVLKEVYSINTGKHRDTFPITSLNSSGTFVPTSKDSVKKQMSNALSEVKNLFRKPLCGRLCLFSVISFVCLLAYSSLRMWYPQISTIVENYRETHNQTDWFCEIMTEYTDGMTKEYEDEKNNTMHLENNFTVMKSTFNESKTCIPLISGTETYTNGMLLGLMSLLGIGISTYMVDFFGHKPLMVLMLFFCSACSGAIYWTSSLMTIAILISATCGLMQTALSLQQNLLVRAFPTTLRAISMSIIITFGRGGSLLGSILFPVMLTYGCMVPFITLSALSLTVASLVYFLPSAKKADDRNGDK